MQFPNHPKECQNLLFNQYKNLLNGILSQLQWGIFSGAFNRHIKAKMKQCGLPKENAFKNLYSTWGSLDRLYQLRKEDNLLDKIKVKLNVDKIYTEEKHMQALKEQFKELLNEIR